MDNVKKYGFLFGELLDFVFSVDHDVWTEKAMRKFLEPFQPVKSFKFKKPEISTANPTKLELEFISVISKYLFYIAFDDSIKTKSTLILQALHKFPFLPFSLYENKHHHLKLEQFGPLNLDDYNGLIPEAIIYMH
ncbi:hypothetical protein AAY84_12100 [Serratia marcescens]|uniref:hypothetical protein n=1 Tax=Serratia marcescens TaxID=615 RepID=UPI00062C1A60|nr:hypothetical protein [Serratia marcescens]KKZ18089.1 hypothetical protein AAY84_12100 [Serratia marcescens]